MFPFPLPATWCEDLCEEWRLMANLLDVLKAEVTDQWYVVGIVCVCVYCTVDPYNSKAVH